MINEAGGGATARFNFNSINLPKCCQMVMQIKATHYNNEPFKKKKKQSIKDLCTYTKQKKLLK